MTDTGFVFVGDFEPNPNHLIHEEVVDSRYLGVVNDSDGELTITDETDPAKAWIASTEYLSPEEYRQMRGGE